MRNIVLSVVLAQITFMAPSWSVSASDLAPISARERARLIRAAQVWRPTRIAGMNVMEGPQDAGGFEFEETVSCTYRWKKPGGTTSKFHCTAPDGRDLKVRYDRKNGKVYAMPAATRLFWVLGFGATPSFPVNVECHDCPEDPFEASPSDPVSDRLFTPATIDRKFPGKKIEEKGKKDQGWSWSELDQVREDEGGAPLAHRDALKLLAALVQHGDNNSGQQKLICLPGGIVDDGNGKGICEKPFMFVSDLGSTFGGAELLNEKASMNLAAWARHRVWKDSGRCIADLAHTPDGTLTNPKISEKGRKFLANLLAQLSDRQIEDLFRVGRADQRDQDEEGVRLQSSAPISEWVRVFKEKRAQITQTRCPE